MKSEKMFSDARRVSKQGQFETWIVTCPDVRRLPDPTRYTLTTAIELVKKYKLPCDVEIRELRPPAIAAHAWRKDGTCTIAVSALLNFKGDRRSVRRRIIHEIAHHIVGRGHGHDEVFKRIAAKLYEDEGYPRGRHGDNWGNM
jgi:hypothetical protein